MRVFCLCFFVLALVNLNTNAQWNPNTFVNLEVSGLNCSDQQSISTSDGKTWIAYYSQNSGTGNYDMRAQLLDINGNKLLGANGILVSSQPSGTATFVFNVCKDIFDNLVIAFQYEIGGNLNAVVAKVNADGTLPWGNGVVLGEGLAPYPAITKTNEVVVAWNNNSPSTTYIQKISSSGTLAWSSPTAVTVGTSNTTRAQVVANANGDFTLVFQKRSFGISTTLYAQRYTSGGAPIWTAPVQISNLTSSGARYYSILGDGNTVYFGYYVASGSRFFAYVQKITETGALPWGINGSPVSSYSTGADPQQQTTNIAHDNSSPYIWSVTTYSNPAQTAYGVYVQKFDTTSGTVLLNPQGKEVYPISSNYDTQTGELSLVNDAPFLMSYDVNYKIYATRLNSNGDFYWTSNRIELSSTTSSLAQKKVVSHLRKQLMVSRWLFGTKTVELNTGLMRKTFLSVAFCPLCFRAGRQKKEKTTPHYCNGPLLVKSIVISILLKEARTARLLKASAPSKVRPPMATVVIVNFILLLMRILNLIIFIA